MAERRPHVLIAGVSTRALAVSAARAGYRVTAVDAFGDLDLRAVAEVLPLRRDDGHAVHRRGRCPRRGSGGRRPTPWRTRRTSRTIPTPCRAAGARAAAAGQSAGRARAGPESHRPHARARGDGALPSRDPRERAAGRARAGRWLLKPRRSGGGHGPRRGGAGGRCPAPSLRPGADRAACPARSSSRPTVGDAVALGLSRQLVGERGFGAHGFRYCGSLLASERDAAVRAPGGAAAAARRRWRTR